MIGTVYLIHFHAPYKHARHYMGWTRDLADRLQRHVAGNGANLMRVISNAGIGWTLARTWVGVRQGDERSFKQHSVGRYCPICHPFRGHHTHRGPTGRFTANER